MHNVQECSLNLYIDYRRRKYHVTASKVGIFRLKQGDLEEKLDQWFPNVLMPISAACSPTQSVLDIRGAVVGLSHESNINVSFTLSWMAAE
jgi:hypothetical protein